MATFGRPTILGRARRADALIEFRVVKPRAHTLLVAFEPGTTPEEGAELAGCAIRWDKNEAVLGRCRFESAAARPHRRRDDPPVEPGDGRLVFLDKVWDFTGLASRGVVSDFRQSVEQLPVIWGRKDCIVPAFRDYAAELVFDLQVFRAVFDDLELRLGGESERTRQDLQALVRDEEYPRFKRFLDAKVEALKGLVSGFSRAQHEQHGFYFRKQIWDFILSSELLKRTNLKPRGYAGDSDMMRMLYEDGWRGRTLFQQFMHRYPVRVSAAQAVRNRRELVGSWIRQRAAAHTPADPLQLLSVACGPAWELHEAITSAEDAGRVKLALLDQDVEALAEAEETLRSVGEKAGARLDAKTICGSVRTVLQTSRPAEQWGRFHFVYSMGLFDYLTDSTAGAVLAKLWDLVLPGGELVVGNFHPSNESRVFMEYWADWVLWYRDEQDMLQLARELPGADCRADFEATGCQMFLHARKRG